MIDVIVAWSPTALDPLASVLGMKSLASRNVLLLPNHLLDIELRNSPNVLITEQQTYSSAMP